MVSDEAIGQERAGLAGEALARREANLADHIPDERALREIRGSFEELDRAGRRYLEGSIDAYHEALRIGSSGQVTLAEVDQTWQDAGYSPVERAYMREGVMKHIAESESTALTVPENEGWMAKRKRLRAERAYRNDLFERVVNLEVEWRRRQFRGIRTETSYILEQSQIERWVRAEFTEGDNLRQMPWEVETYTDDYLRNFLGLFDTMITTGLRELELDKDLLFIEALEVLFENAYGSKDVEQVTLNDWNRALQGVEGGVERIVGIYTAADQEDANLLGTVQQRLGQRLYDWTVRAEGVFRNLFKLHKWECTLPQNYAQPELDRYLAEARAKFDFLTGVGKPLDIASVIRVTRSLGSLVPEGNYIIEPNRDKTKIILVPFDNTGEFGEKGRFISKRDGTGNKVAYGESSLLEDALRGVDRLDFNSFVQGIVPISKSGKEEKDLREAVEKYHPHLNQEFLARRMFNARMIERFS